MTFVNQLNHFSFNSLQQQSFLKDLEYLKDVSGKVVPRRKGVLYLFLKQGGINLLKRENWLRPQYTNVKLLMPSW